TLLAARVEEAGAWERAGARSAAEHLAKLGGTTTGAARRSLETSKNVAGLAQMTDALRGGVLSTAQANAIGGAVAADPSAENRLIAFAASTNVAELREEALRVKAAADADPDATHTRLHAQRALRAYTDGEGMRHVHVSGPPDRLSPFETALEPLVDQIFTAARTQNEREPRAAYAFDAFTRLCDRNEAPASAPPRRVQPRYLGLVRVDLEALTRGETQGDETCEIAGVGPVPVRIARQLLGESILKLVITRGVDVVNVVHLGRGPTASQRIAVLWTSPKCANQACSGTFTQIDHNVPWAADRRTVVANLDPLCTHDHDLKTNHGWSLVHGNGRRAFVGPTDSRHPRNRPPP
ncbi:MAG TPA: DUF222 domain-containing protein, partial [Acidimicrobiia bacterium]|nr:DUF222 domain-containing protein [Acidimicrobiia bacterium]